MSLPPTTTPPEAPGADGSRPRGRAATALVRLLRPRHRPGPPRSAPGQRPDVTSDGCRQELARWQRHADSYARELSRVALERAHLLAWLAALHPSSAVVTPTTGGGPDGTHLLRLTAGERQLCWWLQPTELPLFTHVPYAEPTPQCPPRDGHGAADQAAHIRRHTRLLAVEGAFLTTPDEPRPSARPAGH